MTPSRALAALALVVGLGHLMFLPAHLEDIDSVNFALGIRDFDVADHRPHPPGYPVYVALGKVVAAGVGAWPGAGGPSRVEARSLALLSLAAALAAVFLLYRVFAAARPVREARPPWAEIDPVALGATALTMTNPLVWTSSVRPMSDVPGLAFALAAQACLATAWWWQTAPAGGDRRMTPAELIASGRMIVLGALIAGVAVGLRTQTLWLTAPLLGLVLVDRIGRGVAGALMGAVMTSAIGAMAWALPLVIVSGGLGSYLAALGSQAGEDFASGDMLYTNPAPRLVAMALVHTFVDPWDSVPLGAAMLVLASAGAAALLLRDRRTLALVAAMSLPYLGFHLLFQDTSFTRYAAPLVPVVAFLAVRGAALASARVVIPVAAVASLWAVAVASPALAAYAATPAPVVRVVEAMNAEAASRPPSALAMHQTFRRPLEAEDVRVQPQLPAPPRREWLELATFWKQGNAGVLWFLADPRRTDLALVDPQSRRVVTEFAWAPSGRRVFGGLRPGAVSWTRLEPPRWFAEEGWALTPETAGMAALMGRGPHLGGITARVRRDGSAMRLLIGGRHLGAAGDGDVRFTMAIDGRDVESWVASPGFFLRRLGLPAGALTGDGPWAELTIRSSPVTGEAAVPTAIEQFDLQPPEVVMWGLDEGWHEAEYTPALGVWHWTSDRSVLLVAGASTAVTVSLEAESPLQYFDGPSEVVASAGSREVSREILGAGGAWSFEVALEDLQAADGRITLTTSQTFVPAERGGPPDRRRLGLRVFEIRVIPVGLR